MLSPPFLSLHALKGGVKNYLLSVIKAPFLEADVIDVCQLSCKSCGHIAPKYRKNWYTFEAFQEDIHALSKVYRCDTFTILGGEPLLLRDRFPDYVREIRASGISNKIKVNTNGILLPQYGKHLLLCDWVHISHYDTEHKETITAWFNEHQQEFKDKGKEIYLHPVTEFSYAYTEQRLTDERAELSWQKCGARKWCHQLYCGSYYLCGPIAKFHRALDERGIHVEQKGCPLHAPDLEQRLKEYLETKEKVPTCYHCLGHIDYHAWTEEKR